MTAFGGYQVRFTGHSKQGDRKYMEDCFIVSYQPKEDESGRMSVDNMEYSYFGVFDGHGGYEAANFAKDHLMDAIVRERNFWSKRDEDVLKAIRDGFINTHMAMWNEQDKWPKTASGLPSTAGTTASIAFLRHGKIYTGHVGDSAIVLGYQQAGNSMWEAQRLTRDHKPDNVSEMARIKQAGGKVVAKSGVPRVVWYRPQLGHKGPITRSTPFDEIPFLAVARSLGDLWSYNPTNNEFVVSPEPDTYVIPIDLNTFRCLVFGSDGLWNMVTPSLAVSLVQAAEQHNSSKGPGHHPRINPSMTLVERALERWSSSRMRADNTTVVTLILHPVASEARQMYEPRQQSAIPKSRYTEEYLDEIHLQLKQQLLENGSGSPDADSTESRAVAEVPAGEQLSAGTGTIQINVVSSSSDEKNKASRSERVAHKRSKHCSSNVSLESELRLTRSRSLGPESKSSVATWSRNKSRKREHVDSQEEEVLAVKSKRSRSLVLDSADRWTRSHSVGLEHESTVECKDEHAKNQEALVGVRSTRSRSLGSEREHVDNQAENIPVKRRGRPRKTSSSVKDSNEPTQPSRKLKERNVIVDKSSQVESVRNRLRSRSKRPEPGYMSDRG